MRKIDADKLVQSIDRQFELLQIFRNGDKTLKELGGETLKQLGDILHACLMQEIANAPTVDAEPVVRCKDCIHNSLNRRSGNAYCEFGFGLYQLNDFCSRGERREDGNQ